MIIDEILESVLGENMVHYRTIMIFAIVLFTYKLNWHWIRDTSLARDCMNYFRPNGEVWDKSLGVFEIFLGLLITYGASFIIGNFIGLINVYFFKTFGFWFLLGVLLVSTVFIRSIIQYERNEKLQKTLEK